MDILDFMSSKSSVPINNLPLPTEIDSLCEELPMQLVEAIMFVYFYDIIFGVCRSTTNRHVAGDDCVIA